MLPRSCKDVGVHLTVEGEGHTTYGYYDCVTRTVNAYLLDGKIPRSGTRCS
ncbi:alpha/beta hydrolase [Streptomyces lunaelactis]|uniref:alpha/beta hydrolase n=1 Tax=Streptomyces lunaelactis TaxID=1535768 RepID=UPI0015854DFF|nr:alpha/beta hydrolase [Streptomyces lunaelactis]